MDPLIEKKTLTGAHAVSMGWVIADSRNSRSASARLFSALNDNRYEVKLGDQVVTADDVVTEVTKLSYRDDRGSIYAIDDNITSITIAGIPVPLFKGPMVSVRKGIARIGKLPVTAIQKAA